MVSTIANNIYLFFFLHPLKCLVGWVLYHIYLCTLFNTKFILHTQTQRITHTYARTHIHAYMYIYIYIYI